MNNLRPRYWIPVADTFRVIVAIVLAIIIILLLLRACNTVTPTIVGPSAGAQPVTGQPIDLSGVATPNAVVRVFDGNTPVGETTADANGSWKLTLPAGLGVGTHELTARVFRGNAQVASSAPLSLSVAALPATPVPTAPPTPTAPPVPTAPPPIIKYPAPGAALKVGDLGTVTGSAPPGSKLQILEGDKLLGEITADSSGQWNWELPASLTSGAHSLIVKALLSDGKAIASSPLNITIEAPRPTPVAPAINIPIAGAVLMADKPGDVVGIAAPGSKVQILDGDKLLGEVIADPNGRWSFGLPSPLPAGTHTLQSVVLDATGKEAARSPAVSIEIKSIEAPAILPIANGQLGIGSVVKGKAQPGSVVSIFDGDKLLGTATAGADGVWEFALPKSLQAGVVNLRAAILNSTGAVLSQSEVTRIQIIPSVLPASGGAEPGP